MKRSKTFLISSLFCILLNVNLKAQESSGGESTEGGGGAIKNAAYWTLDFLMNLAQREQTDKLYDEYVKIYNTLKDGYLVVRTLTDKNKDLHEKFFESLGTVSPIVREYYKVILITKTYTQMVSSVDEIIETYKANEVFSDKEIEYMSKVYAGMLARVKNNSEELLKVITDKELQMMDAERIKTIDRIYEETNLIYKDLKNFNHINLYRAKNRGLKDGNSFQKLYELI